MRHFPQPRVAGCPPGLFVYAPRYCGGCRDVVVGVCQHVAENSDVWSRLSEIEDALVNHTLHIEEHQRCLDSLNRKIERLRAKIDRKRAL